MKGLFSLESPSQSASAQFTQERTPSGGAWVAQSVKHPTPDFSSGHDLTVHEIKPRIRLSAVSVEPASFRSSVSLSLCLCPSLSKVNIKTKQKQAKQKKKTIKTKTNKKSPQKPKKQNKTCQLLSLLSGQTPNSYEACEASGICSLTLFHAIHMHGSSLRLAVHR